MSELHVVDFHICSGACACLCLPDVGAIDKYSNYIFGWVETIPTGLARYVVSNSFIIARTQGERPTGSRS